MTGLRITAAAAVLLGAVLPAQTVKTLVSNGPPARKYDMVILGDGYRAVEEGTFDADCQRFVQALFAKEPYRTYAAYVNVHTVFRASNESGADHPDASPPIFKDTAYDGSASASAMFWIDPTEQTQPFLQNPK